MRLWAVLFRRGADKLYLACFLSCLVYILLSDTSSWQDRSLPSTPASAQDRHALVVPINVTASPHLHDPHEPAGGPETFDEDPPAASKEPIVTAFTANPEPWTPPRVLGVNNDRMAATPPFISAIMNPKELSYDRLICPEPKQDRYAGLQRPADLIFKPDQLLPRYFFALNLYKCAYVLPRLMGSIVEAIRFLGPQDCVLSIVGGRSDDGTTEILARLRMEIEGLGAAYYFSTSDIDPMMPGHDRVTELAKLRNLALDPLTQQPHKYSVDTTVLFINDVALCVEDILELLYQRRHQDAHMVCALDWINNADLFYDVWVSRGLTGDLFFEIPQSGSWDFAHNLFWNDPKSKRALQAHIPFQVYSCWNGAVAFTAEPLILHGVRFRASYDHECYMGEPTLFCKDLWKHGYGRIAVIPSVNLGYSDEQSRYVKGLRGYTSTWVEYTAAAHYPNIEWQEKPPSLIKCEPDWRTPSWVAWDEAKEQLSHDWSQSGYFMASKPSDFDHPPDHTADDAKPNGQDPQPQPGDAPKQDSPQGDAPNQEPQGGSPYQQQQQQQPASGGAATPHDTVSGDDYDAVADAVDHALDEYTTQEMVDVLEKAADKVDSNDQTNGGRNDPAQPGSENPTSQREVQEPESTRPMGEDAMSGPRRPPADSGRDHSPQGADGPDRGPERPPTTRDDAPDLKGKRKGEEVDVEERTDNR